MDSNDPDARGDAGRPSALERWPTGAKLLFFLSAALLPLAIIAVVAALQTTRHADMENRAQLRVAAVEGARTMAIELIGDINALSDALHAIEADPEDSPSCARVRGVLAPGISRGVRFGIIDVAGRLRCGVRVHDEGLARSERGLATRVLPERGLVVTTAGSRGKARATIFFPAAFLDEISRPTAFQREYGAELSGEGGTLVMREQGKLRLARRDSMRVSVGLSDLSFTMSVQSAPITSPVLIAMVLPIVMWLAAATITWAIISRLLIRPLSRLSGEVGRYRPGELFDPTAIGTMQAQEIRELGERFGNLSRTIRAHEEDLAEGLIRQTKLTREVHHRVKNNLQVIASLINFHARSAASPDVSAAYASIQRRVDALAVVHRNHYAELEVNRGLGLRSVVGELAANLRATAPEGGRQLGITLEIEPYLVTQDTAVAVAFLITELIELAMSANPNAQLRISVKAGESDTRAVLRLSSPALIEGEALARLVATRYGRVIEGLARQLRSKLHHDPLAGAYEIAISVTGRD